MVSGDNRPIKLETVETTSTDFVGQQSGRRHARKEKKSSRQRKELTPYVMALGIIGRPVTGFIMPGRRKKTLGQLMNYLKEGYSKPGMENEMTATEANRAVSPRQKTQAVSPRRWAVNA